MDLSLGQGQHMVRQVDDVVQMWNRSSFQFDRDMGHVVELPVCLGHKEIWNDT